MLLQIFPNLIGLLLQTDEPIARSFILDNEIVMNVILSNTQTNQPFVSSLMWSHNGTELISDGRVSIDNNGTSLTISNMVQSDAGRYEVKINSTVLDDGRTCNTNILPMLENIALHAPMTFLLQENSLPTYTPEDAIVNYDIPAYQYINKQLAINNTFMVNVPAVLNETKIFNNLFRDGVGIFINETYNSTWSYGSFTTQYLTISYNNSDDIAGQYVVQQFTNYEAFDQAVCPGYFDYIRDNIGFLPIFSLYLSITSKSKLLFRYTH